MPLTDMAALAAAKLYIGDLQTIFSNTTARIGVGDSTIVFSKTHIDLQAATNKLRKGMDSGFPTRLNAVLTFRSTYGTGEANWTWQEWAVFNAAPSGGDMMNRKVESLGTKTSAQSWQFTVDIALQV